MSEQEMYAYSQLSNQSNSQTDPPATYSSLANNSTNNQSSSIFEGAGITGENVAGGLAETSTVIGAPYIGTKIGTAIGGTMGGSIGAGIGVVVGSILAKPAEQIGRNIYNNYLKEPINDYFTKQGETFAQQLQDYNECKENFTFGNIRCNSLNPLPLPDSDYLRRMK